MQNNNTKQDTKQDYYLHDLTPEERAFIELYEAWCKLPEGEAKNELSRKLIKDGQYLGVYPIARK